MERLTDADMIGATEFCERRFEGEVYGAFALRPLGQEPPDRGDGVLYSCAVLIPAYCEGPARDYYTILPHLQFRTRVTVCGDALYGGWGGLSAPAGFWLGRWPEEVRRGDDYYFRSCVSTHKGDTWQVARDAALARAEEQLDILLAALVQRRDALAAAGPLPGRPAHADESVVLKTRKLQLGT